MEFLDVVREQAALLGHGSQVDRTVCSEGVAIIQPREPVAHLNCFYPLERDFRYSTDVLRGLRELFLSKGVDGWIFDAREQFTVDGAKWTACVHVPAGAVVRGPVDDGFQCVRTSDVGRWSKAYTDAQPGRSPDSFKERTSRIMGLCETQLYLFMYSGEVVGAGSLVRTGGDAWLANGFAVKQDFRGGILGRARAVRMATGSDVVAMTDIRFARVLERALAGASILGAGQFLRLGDVMAGECAPGRRPLALPAA